MRQLPTRNLDGALLADDRRAAKHGGRSLEADFAKRDRHRHQRGLQRLVRKGDGTLAERAAAPLVIADVTFCNKVAAARLPIAVVLLADRQPA